MQPTGNKTPQCAIVLAANEFNDSRVTNLKWAEDDAIAFEKFLQTEAGFERDDVAAFLGPKLVKETVFEQTHAFAERLIERGGGKLFIYYSGHGYSYGKTNALLCPRSKNDSPIPSNHMDIKEFQNAITIPRLVGHISKAGIRCQLIIDACRERLLARAKGQKGMMDQDLSGFRMVGFTPSKRQRSAKNVSTWCIAAACSDGEMACEIDELKHGVFTYALLNRLRSDWEAKKTLQITKDYIDGLSGEIKKLRDEFMPGIQTPWHNAGEAPVLVMGNTPPEESNPQKPIRISKPRPQMLPPSFESSLGMKFKLIPVSCDGSRKILFSIWPTRVRDYEAFSKSSDGIDSKWKQPKYKGVLLTPKPTCPVVFVSWNDANAFCAWLTELERKNHKIPAQGRYRLPTDVEWSWAVGIGEEEDKKGADRPPEEKHCEIQGGDAEYAYPWGGMFPPPPKTGNYFDATALKQFPGRDPIPGLGDGWATTSPVGAYPANQNKLHDLGGNVWEWCMDQMRPNGKVLRGASWDDSDSRRLLASFREHARETVRTAFYGFRVVIELKGD